MERIKIKAEDFSEYTGLRLDQFLSRTVPQLSRSAAERLIQEGNVSISGGEANKKRLVAETDVIEVTLPEAKPDTALPEDIPLDVVYEDSDLIVINKPRGMVVHPAAGHNSGTLVNALLYHCAGSLSGIGGIERPGIVHRIDKDTSGLIVCAKNDETHKALAAQLKTRRMGRIYETVARGGFDADSFTVDSPIGRHPADRKKMAINKKNGRNAVTRFYVVARYSGYTHLRCELETGRTHQIRVHLASLGHPVAGDPLYGSRKEAERLGGQILHARTLKLVHPRSRQEMRFDTNLPEYFTEFLFSLTN